MSGFVSVGYFLIGLFFNILIFALWIRLALRYFHVSALHPVGQLIYNLTNPVVKPAERLFFSGKTAAKRYDWAGFSVLVAVELLKFIILGLLLYGALLPLSYLVLFTLADLIVQPCNLLFYIILIRVIMSWVNPGWQHPVADIMRLITEPFLEMGRRLVPNISGFDFSPFIILIILKIITLFIGGSMPLRLL
ncbi:MULTISPECIES: YggT family protein [unclassified Legionella]|uniref:YggT family protein n=1 Tax=unclassified Legionella TaxID=2622702 RepID=UPI00105441C2|nr:MULTISPECIES: YggT family protein [unclassified Legionella]MDI9817956.1 YggT family protein [Legionella sp. PL877]